MLSQNITLAGDKRPGLAGANPFNLLVI